MTVTDQKISEMTPYTLCALTETGWGSPGCRWPVPPSPASDPRGVRCQGGVRNCPPEWNRAIGLGLLGAVCPPAPAERPVLVFCWVDGVTEAMSGSVGRCAARSVARWLDTAPGEPGAPC